MALWSQTCFLCQVLLGLLKWEGAKDNPRHHENVLMTLFISVYSQGAKNLPDCFSNRCVEGLIPEKGLVTVLGPQMHPSPSDSPWALQRRMRSMSVRWTNHKTFFPPDFNRRWILKQPQLFCLLAKKTALKAAGNMSDFKGKYIGGSLAWIQHYVGK